MLGYVICGQSSFHGFLPNKTSLFSCFHLFLPIYLLLGGEGIFFLFRFNRKLFDISRMFLSTLAGLIQVLREPHAGPVSNQSPYKSVLHKMPECFFFFVKAFFSV